MSSTTNTKTPLQVLRDYVERSTHWQEGGADRHAALLALEALEADDQATAQPVGTIFRAHLSRVDAEPWCREILLYSPNNQGDRPESRVMLYTAGRLSDALDWAEKGMAEWRAAAMKGAAQTRAAEATSRVAIGHLHSVLNKCRSAAEQQKADTDARDWLESIGSEPI